MLKTPISILQELAVQKKLPLPNYEDTSESGEPHCKNFTCSVKIGTHEASGTGKTKKEAKHNAASNLLEVFGVKVDATEQMSNICLLPKTVRSSTSPTINFIGKLNEFSSGRRYPQPVYTASPTVHDGQFCMVCTFLNMKTEGFGFNKKDAKQDSAKKMLSLITVNNIGDNTSDKLSKLNETEGDDTNLEQVLHKYTNIMNDLFISDRSGAPTKTNDNPDSLNKGIDISNWDELVTYMNNKGWKHQVTEVQRSPLILCLKVNDHTLMNFGATLGEVRAKFVHSVLQMLNSGVDFDEPLVASSAAE